MYGGMYFASTGYAMIPVMAGMILAATTTLTRAITLEAESETISLTTNVGEVSL